MKALSTDKSGGPSQSPYYTYKKLSHHDVRLLRLRPLDDPTVDRHWNQPVEATLEACSLNEAKFNALSYTWGPPTIEDEEALAQQVFTTVARCYPILVSNKIVLVTRSLRDALRSIRLREHPLVVENMSKRTNGQCRAAGSFLWADGICINQDDVEERAQQVTLMAELYSKAHTIYCWIGQRDDDTAEALNTARTMTMFHIETFGKDLKSVDRQAFDSISGKEWWAWCKLISRSWFQRCWVLQEAIVSHDERAQLLCGEIVVRLGMVLRNLMLLTEPRWSIHILEKLNAVAHQVPKSDVYHPKVMTWFAQNHPYLAVYGATINKQKLPFFTLCNKVIPFTHCADPRDRIYATLGCCDEWEDLDPALLRVDYTMDVGAVYSQATKYIINKLGSLDLLSLVSAERKQNGTCALPSWCPNYAEAKEAFSVPTMNEAEGSSMNVPGLFSSAGRSLCHPDLTSSSLDILTVSGVQIDVIQKSALVGNSSMDISAFTACFELLEQAITADPERGWLLAFHQTMLFFGRFHTHVDPRIIGSPELFAITLEMNPVGSIWNFKIDVADIKLHIDQLCSTIDRIRRVLTKKVDEHSYLPNTAYLQDELQRRIRCDKTIGEDHSFLAKQAERRAHTFGTSRVSDVAELDNLINLRRQIIRVASFRRLFSTQNRRALGMGHRTILPGDEVWLLAGGRTPFILRKDGSGRRYAFVGEAYVHGAMFGELWPREQSELTDVVLC